MSRSRSRAFVEYLRAIPEQTAPSSNVYVEEFVADGVQTDFVCTYGGSIQIVMLNGVALDVADYSVTDATVTFAVAPVGTLKLMSTTSGVAAVTNTGTAETPVSGAGEFPPITNDMKYMFLFKQENARFDYDEVSSDFLAATNTLNETNYEFVGTRGIRLKAGLDRNARGAFMVRQGEYVYTEAQTGMTRVFDFRSYNIPSERRTFVDGYSDGNTQYYFRLDQYPEGFKYGTDRNADTLVPGQIDSWGDVNDGDVHRLAVTYRPDTQVFAFCLDGKGSNYYEVLSANAYPKAEALLPNFFTTYSEAIGGRFAPSQGASSAFMQDADYLLYALYDSPRTENELVALSART